MKIATKTLRAGVPSLKSGHGEANRVKPAGRPKLPKAQRKDRYISIRLTPGEYKIIAAAAKISELKISAWIRQVAVDGAVKSGQREHGVW